MSIIVKNTKEGFIENIKKWIILDTQIKNVNEKMKNIRDMKNNLTSQICEYMKHNNVKNKIEISDGDLKLYEKKEYSPLTFSYIENTLNIIIKDTEQIKYIMKTLKENREIKITSDIRRTMNNEQR